MTEKTELNGITEPVAAPASLALQVVASLSIGILGLALAPWLLNRSLPRLQAASSIMAIVLGLLSIGLLRSGRHRLGVLSLAAAVWAHVAWPMMWLGLRYSLLGTRFAVLPLALVALLLGRRDLWATFAAFVGAAALGEARDLGWLGQATSLPTLMPTRPLLSTLVLFLLAALLLDRLAGSLRQALADALRGNEALREQAKLREQLRQAQKMEAIGRLAGGVAHDFNNILTSIVASASLAKEELPVGHKARADLEQICVDSGRASELTRQLLACARKQVLSPKVVDIDCVVEGVAKMLQRLLGASITLEMRLTSKAQVFIDEGQLEQVLLNLAVNARDAMPDGGRLIISTEAQAPTRKDGNGVGGTHVLLSVRDDGSGIPADVLPQIFEPFFTTKGAEQGTGLGLATCHGIVAQAGGDITVHSKVGEGTTFEIRLPEASSESDDSAVFRLSGETNFTE